MITFKVEGIYKAAQELKQFDFKIRRNIVQSATRAGINVMRTKARQLAPKRTGLLAKQLTTGIKTDRVTGIVTGTLKPKRTKAARRKKIKHSGHYLHMVVGGTKAHRIEAPKGEAMKFGGGYLTRVDHPGARAQPFMDQAYDQGYRGALVMFASKFDERVSIEITKRNAANVK